MHGFTQEKNPESLKMCSPHLSVVNADGNEKISPLNRTYQNGPVNGVGVRYNGQSSI